MTRKMVGFTLSELLVSIVIISILGFGTSVAVLSFTKRNLQEANTGTSRAQLQRAMTYLTRDLRKAVRIATAPDNNLLPNYSASQPLRPVLALWRLRDGDLGTNASSCTRASPYEFRAYYLVPATTGLRGPNVLALYIDNCPDIAVTSEGAIPTGWISPVPTTPTNLNGSTNVFPLTDSIAAGGFTALDPTLTVPAALLSSTNTNPSGASIRIQGAVDDDLLGGATSQQKIEQQRALTLNTSVARNNY